MNLRANEGIKEISLTKHFTKLLHELEYCSEDEQKQKITEFNGLLDEMGTKEIFEKMIIDENEKKEGKNEKLLVDLCECYLLFYSGVFSSKMLSLCVPCLLKFALKKEEREKVQKEVEMALLALSCIDVICV
eukprot:MONOS_420.1-p1 / transcript=MONOS_420.1 / gene=MONOS_420 / organism=Monocercomonoides_exilis_PA203 / gene_product=unspecified product / transcript_product=unspecified product / location=Mono_scaffold00007:27207-27823(-) / protein_length=132 / sequence_SO=supercontig / SO=protein_coding / is_pseudo=false